MNNKIPRRSRLDLNTKAELSITNSIDEVEKIGADERLTNAQIKLQEAKDLVSDYVDEMFQSCESCQIPHDMEQMSEDDDSNWFCAKCWEELSPVMKAEYQELVENEIKESICFNADCFMNDEANNKCCFPSKFSACEKRQTSNHS